MLLTLHGLVHADALYLENGSAPAEFRCPAGAIGTVRPFSSANDFSRIKLPSASAQTHTEPYRVALWGDSHTSSGSFVDAMLAAYGIEPRSALPAFIPATFKLKGVRFPLKSICVSSTWRTAFAYRAAATQRTKTGLVALNSDDPGSFLWMDFRWPLASSRVASVALHFSKVDPDRTLVIGVSADSGPEKLIVLNRASGNILEIRSTGPISTLQFRIVAGQMTLDGVAPRYQTKPAMVMDVFSFPGAIAKGWQRADLTGSALGGGSVTYDLALLQYGTNEAADSRFRAEEYAVSLRSSLSQFRTLYPTTRCVLLGPPDRGVRSRQTGRTTAETDDPFWNSRTHQQIAALQSRIGSDFNCAFWDWQLAMGGPQSAFQWAHANPPLMQPDLIHLMPKGYEISGRAFANAFPNAIRQGH